MNGSYPIKSSRLLFNERLFEETNVICLALRPWSPSGQAGSITHQLPFQLRTDRQHGSLVINCEGDKMDLATVKKMAKGLGLAPGRKTKVELIHAIQKAEGNFDCFGTAIDYCDQMDCCFKDECLASSRSHG